MKPRLPDFLVIGAFKCGTTSLASYLSQHPRVFMPWLQEPNFFGSPRYSLTLAGDTRPSRDPGSIYGRMRTDTLGQYAGLFAGAPPDAVVGESSPQYLRSPEAAARIRSVLPGARLVALLRHPADRAFSDYSMFVRDGLEREDFATAIRRKPSGEAGSHYVTTGFYGQQLQRYVESTPPEQLRVLLLEDLQADPHAVLASLFAWLGVDDEFRPDVAEVRNVSGVPRNRLVATGYTLRRRLQPYLKPVVPRAVQRRVDARLTAGLQRRVPDPESRSYLLEMYRDDIRLLSELIDRDLTHWLA